MAILKITKMLKHLIFNYKVGFLDLDIKNSRKEARF